MAAARSCSALPAQYINPVLPQGYYRDLQTESLGLIICQHVWKCVPSVVAEQILSQSWLVNVSGAPSCLPGYLTPDRDRDSCISLCHALGGAVGTSGHLQHQDPGLKYQNNCGKRGILITKAEIFEVTNVSVLYSSSLPWPSLVVWRWYMIHDDGQGWPQDGRHQRLWLICHSCPAVNILLTTLSCDRKFLPFQALAEVNRLFLLIW